MNQNSIFTYSYRFEGRQLFNLILGLGFIVFAFVLLIRIELDNTLKALVALFSIMGIIPLMLTIHYLIRSIGLRIQFDQNKQLVEVTYGNKTELFKLSEIASIEICEYESIGFYGFDFDFAKYTFENGKFCVATSFMTNEYFVPENIEPRIYKELLPIIWKRTKL